MYEGNILNLGSIAPWDGVVRGPDGLHAVSWDELVLRLRAARDLRHLLEEENPGTNGSFNHSSARQVAVLAVRQRGINPFALTDRKLGESMSLDLSRDETTCDRGSK